MPFARSLGRNKLLWPIVALGCLLLFNFFFTPNFFRMEMKEGHLYGNLIDILKNAAPIMLLAVGLTLVIATKGIDISVGSVVAISAGVVAILLGGDLGGVPRNPLWVALLVAVLASTAAGAWNGLLVSRIGHAAHHRNPDPVRGRARDRDGADQRDGHLDLREAVRHLRPGLLAGPALLASTWWRGFCSSPGW